MDIKLDKSQNVLDEWVTLQLDQKKETNTYRDLYGFYDQLQLNCKDFTSNDIYGISFNSYIKEKALTISKDLALGAGGSRFICGNSELYQKLELLLSKANNKEKTRVFGSGYLANIGVISALLNRYDLIIADKYVHASILDGIKISGAKLIRFNHNSHISCEDILARERKNYTKALIVTESVFSMHGDQSPMLELSKLAKKYDSWFMVDNSHGKLFTHINADIITSTFSKALGCYGGYVVANSNIIDYITNYSRSLIFSTALPPIVLATAYTALKFFIDNKGIIDNPMKNAMYFAELVNLPKPVSHIVSIKIGKESDAVNIANDLYKEGFKVSAIRHPTVMKNQALLRLCFASFHNKDDIQSLAQKLLSAMGNLKVENP